MKNSKHTPDPWIYDAGIGEVRSANGAFVATQMHNGDGPLIAAAPELLAALELAEVTIRRLAKTDSANGTFDVIAAVIAKATGETP